MLNQSNVVAFVATSRPDETKHFYQEHLGLRLVSDDAFAMVFEAHGVMLRIQIVQEHSPQPHTVLGWDVADIQRTIELLSAKGVSFEHYEWLEQDALGIWDSPSGARIAWFKDPDENMLSLTQFP